MRVPEYVRVPDAMANLALVPDNLTDEQVLMCPDIMSTGFSGAESGGTRIGDTLAEFNRLWSRRVLGQGAVVLLITDGLERDDTAGLAQEMERLQKSCRRLIWLNPLLRFDGFEARARGVRAMLPYVDEFRSVQNLEALSDLCASLGSQPPSTVDPRRWLDAGGRRAA